MPIEGVLLPDYPEALRALISAQAAELAAARAGLVAKAPFADGRGRAETASASCTTSRTRRAAGPPTGGLIRPGEGHTADR